MAGEHDRTKFHYGTEDINTAVLAADIGRYPAGMSLQLVLEDFVRRLEFVETAGCDTHLLFFTGNALLLAVRTGSFTANAELIGPNFKMDAVLLGPQSVSFTANAVIVEDVTCP